MYMIRHGNSDGNKMGIIQWEIFNPWLSEEWKEHVQKLSATFDKNVSTIRCSDLKRAIETAVFFCMSKQIPIVIHNELREFGSWILQWLSHKEAEEKYPQAYAIWKQRWDLDWIPWAETWNELQARVLSFLLQYVGKDSYNELLVSHAGYLRCLINTISFRDRTTPIDVSHNTIHEMDNILSNIHFTPHGSGEKSKTYKVQTFDNTYFIKQTYWWSFDTMLIKKNIIAHINKYSPMAPQIYFSSEKEWEYGKLVIEIMQYLNWEHVTWDMLPEKKDMISNFFKQLSAHLYVYYSSHEIAHLPKLKDKLAHGLQHIVDLDLPGVDQIMQFLEQNVPTQSLIYYDIHRQNLLFSQEKMYIVDMDSLLIWPKGFQLACLANFFAFEWITVDIESLIANRWEDVDAHTIKILMKARCLIGIIFFAKKLKVDSTPQDQSYLDRYIKTYSSIKI